MKNQQHGFRQLAATILSKILEHRFLCILRSQYIGKIASIDFTGEQSWLPFTTVGVNKSSIVCNEKNRETFFMFHGKN